jgi:hypothetical protein
MTFIYGSDFSIQIYLYIIISKKSRKTMSLNNFNFGSDNDSADDKRDPPITVPSINKQHKSSKNKQPSKYHFYLPFLNNLNN